MSGILGFGELIVCVWFMWWLCRYGSSGSYGSDGGCYCGGFSYGVFGGLVFVSEYFLWRGVLIGDVIVGVWGCFIFIGIWRSVIISSWILSRVRRIFIVFIRWV